MATTIRPDHYIGRADGYLRAHVEQARVNTHEAVRWSAAMNKHNEIHQALLTAHTALALAHELLNADSEGARHD